MGRGGSPRCAFEDAPFPIRIRAGADRATGAFGLLARADPASDATPFWSAPAPWE